MFKRPTRTLLTLGAVASLAVSGAAAAPAMARNGADDPPGHDRFDDHGGRGKARHASRENELRHGADDPAGHQRHGGDDGPNHT